MKGRYNGMMMKTALLSVLLMLLVISCAGCGMGTDADETSMGTAAVTAEADGGDEENLPSAPENAEALFESGKNFAAYYTSARPDCYTVQIFDDNLKITAEFVSSDAPVFAVTEYGGEAAVGVSRGARTEFYIVRTGEVSPAYTGFMDVYGENILIGSSEKLTVSDIFDAEKYTCDVVVFGENTTYGYDDMLGGYFNEDGASITVAYEDAENAAVTEVYTFER